MAFSPDGNLLFTASRRGVSAWETTGWRHLGIRPCKGSAVSVIPAEQSALTVTDGSGVHRVPWIWQQGDKALQFGTAVPAGPGGRCNHAGQKAGLLAVSRVTPEAVFGERIEIWRAGAMTRSWDFMYRPRSKPVWLSSWPTPEISPDGAWVAIGGSGPCLPLLFQTDATPEIMDARSCLEKVVQEGAACAFSPNSRTLAVQSIGNVSLWDVTTRTLRHRMARPSGSLGYLTAFSPDGRLLVAMGPHWDIWLINPVTGERIATLTPPEPAMTGAVSFSPDGSLLAAALVNEQVQVWNLPALRKELAAEGLDWE